MKLDSNFPIKTTRERTIKLFQEEEMGRMSTPNESRTIIKSTVLGKEEGPLFKIVDKNELNHILIRYFFYIRRYIKI